jgi:hypothetical protein
MTHKDYEIIAKAFATQTDHMREEGRVLALIVVSQFAVHMAEKLRDANDRFNRDRFLDACKVFYPQEDMP